MSATPARRAIGWMLARGDEVTFPQRCACQSRGIDDSGEASAGHEIVTALIDAREPQDDLEAQRFRSVVEQRLFDVHADPVRIGRYMVLRRVGGSGVGVVYAAHDSELGRNVAVKLLQPPMRRGAGAADASERLFRKAGRWLASITRT